MVAAPQQQSLSVLRATLQAAPGGMTENVAYEVAGGTPSRYYFTESEAECRMNLPMLLSKVIAPIFDPTTYLLLILSAAAGNRGSGWWWPVGGAIVYSIFSHFMLGYWLQQSGGDPRVLPTSLAIGIILTAYCGLAFYIGHRYQTKSKPQ
jgi:hypothetical protein